MSAANSSRSSVPPSPRARSSQIGRPGHWVRAFVAFAVMLVGAIVVASPASAAPVYEITGRWADDTPSPVRPGEVVTAEWRVNVNDDAEAPSNDPVDNVTFTVTATNGEIAAIPDVCLIEGVDPVSAISADGRTLTCNLGTQNMGTAVSVQVPVIADGATGDELSLFGEIEGQQAAVDPIPIVGEFGMDITWESPSAYTRWPSDAAVDVSFEWTLNLLKGSDPGPDSVSYVLDLDPSVGGPAQALNCGAFVAAVPSGHPNSGGNHPSEQTAPFVDSCTLTPTATPNRFQLTLTGIDYSLTQVPIQDSGGDDLPVDRNAVASGQVAFRLPMSEPQTGSLVLTSSAPMYTSANGALTATDDPENNTVSKTFAPPGGWASALSRPYTGSGGTNWDDSYRAAPGTELRANNHSAQHRSPANAGRIIQQCTVVDTAYATASRPPVFAPGDGSGAQPVDFDPDIQVLYFVGTDARLTPGATYDPEAFAGNCSGQTGWTATMPADLSTVKAYRAVYNADNVQEYPSILLLTHFTINDNVPVGQDIWQFSSFKVGTDQWMYGESRGPAGNLVPATGITDTPNARYPYTTAWRDLVRVVGVQPYVEKSVDRSSVRVGDPAVYTLSYAANGGASAPETVDDFVITDTLPAAMTYVTGSASPEPQLSTDGQGRQVLTWTFDGLASNQLHTLTYQAVANESAEPGEQLVNTAVASVQGQNSPPAEVTVTLSESGSTEISKVADEAFIPNVNGDGIGDGSWTVTLRSFDPSPQAFTDTIDVLPYRGDGRGTSYSGSYELTGVTAVPGATVYYTDADPATLSDDPAAAANGAAGDPTGNTVGWTTTMPTEVTAVRVIGPELAPGATQAFTVEVATHGAVGGDVLVNRAQARAEHTELVMRTSAPVTVANYYSASLKKFVQDRDGVWRDANDVTDYPTFGYGDTVNYRIVVTNTGQGTLTNVEVSDDRQPALGGFTIASLAPGASQSHEYSIVLDESMTGPVVNTASATADPPPDSNVPPTIPSDPAGFEVANYTTEKTSDPVSGSAVAPGDKVTYTVTVTQQGTAAAQATFTDALGDVLDNATYNGDVKTSLGTVSDQGGNIAWNGTLPVGGVATITYSVTVKAKTGGDFDLLNVVTSQGCRVVAGQTPDCTTTHPAGEFTYSKTSNPKSTSAVQIGDTITYTVGVNQTGAGAVAGATITDDLSKVLDDADYNGDATATAGTVSVTGDKLTWTGDLAVGATVTITYSVTVVADVHHGPVTIAAGDDKLLNVVTGGPGGACVPAPDQNPACTTTHTRDESFDLVLHKRVVSGAQASVDDRVRYKLQVSNKGPDAAPGPIKLTDPLPKGLELVSAKGKGWKCKVAKATDKVKCVRKRGLGADRKAAPVFVVAKATKAAMGRVVNVASVGVAGESVRSNNRDTASITVVPGQLPSTGFRLMPPGA